MLSWILLCAGSLAVTPSGYVVEHTVQLIDPVELDGLSREHHLVQHFNRDGEVVGYQMDLRIDVCLERICKMVEVTLFWDSDGNYQKLETPLKAPLTKHDHDLFTRSDYYKLDQILKDRDSMLGRYPLSFFVTASYDYGIDAISGATHKRAAGEIVSGAAYSTWVLWRWVHGDVTREMKRLSEQAES